MHPSRSRGRPAATTAACLALLLAPPLLHAQSGTAGADPAGGGQSHEAAPRATAVRATRPIAVNGRLDDAVWANAPAITEFTQVDPNEGAPASQRSEVRIAYDESAVYIGAMLYDDGEVVSRLARRDASMNDSDVFTVTLDSYHDHRTAYRFATNPSGLRRDELVSSNGADDSWDPVWAVETERTAEGWSVEMRIPFSQLRFTPAEEQTWGVQLERTILRNQERVQFSFTPKLERDGVQRFGHLDGIERIRPARRLELLPYVTARAEYLNAAAVPGVAFANPFRSGSETAAEAGLDLKYRITSNLTLDATLNPDFGQVEVDPAVINLTAFETRFEERRPFFVEGAEIFRFGEGGPMGSTGRAPEVLYSRRIGRSPQGPTPADAVFSEEPTATTILGAAKLTGRTANGWSLGLLEAVTGREAVSFVDAAGAGGEAVVEPGTNYLVGRVRRDVRGGSTRFGAVFTAVNRDLADPGLRGRLHSAAYSTGLDLIHEWGGRTWRLSSSFSPSLVVGRPEALIRTQQTSTRYFNRPDADHLRVDSAATRLTGYYAMTELNKQAGTWTGRIGLGATSPGYEVNDIGFQSYADRLIMDTHLQYNQLRPGRLLRRWSLFGGPDNIWTYAGEHVLSNVNVLGNFQWVNYWGTSFRVDYTPQTYDDRLTRGGPLALDPTGLQARVTVNTDSRLPHSLSANVTVGSDRGGSWTRAADLTLNYRPRENWHLQVGPNVTRSYAAAQYVTSVPDPRAASTHGRRYVFAGLHQTTIGVDTRVNVTFSPGLSFELYAQPFLSNGDYGSLKELAAPRTFDFLEYGEDVGTVERQADGFFRVSPTGDGGGRTFLVRDRDFNFRSLLGNAVLRWEWRQGSTLYLVWQQSRERTVTGTEVDPALQRVGDLDLGRDARELFGIRPDNILAVKVNYWLNP